MKYLIAIITALAISACAGAATERATTALNVLAQTIGPSSRLALEQCKAIREMLSDAGETAKLDAHNERCAVVADAFDRIATLHAAAAEAVENGNVALAEQIAAQIPKLWRDIGGVQ
jgi:hypothetical protein